MFDLYVLKQGPKCNLRLHDLPGDVEDWPADTNVRKLKLAATSENLSDTALTAPLGRFA